MKALIGVPDTGLTFSCKMFVVRKCAQGMRDGDAASCRWAVCIHLSGRVYGAVQYRYNQLMQESGCQL